MIKIHHCYSVELERRYLVEESFLNSRGIFSGKNGNPATKIVQVGENYSVSFEKTMESDDDDRTIPESSSAPRFIHEKLPDNGDEISTTKEAHVTFTTPNKFTGAFRKKGRWWSEIRNPFTKRRIYLGTFNTPQEASNAYTAKKLEFQNKKEALICIDDRWQPAKSSSYKRPRIDHVNEGEEISGSKEEDKDRPRSIPNKFPGIRREKTGRWGASIHDPFTKRQSWLGTFDTPEEASSVYQAKRIEFLNRKKGLIDAPEYSVQDKEDHQTPENSSLVKRQKVFHKKIVKSDNGEEKSSTNVADLTGTTQTTRLIGAYRQKHGRWTSETRDPFCNKRINLGMFDTPEEASNAFLAKKLEFQKLKEAGEQVKVDHWKVRKPGKLLSIKPPRVVHETILKDSNKGEENSSSKEEEADRTRNTPNKFRGIRREKNGRWGAQIHDPFTKRQIWLGTFDTPEEASNVYEAKRLGFLNRKEGLIDAPDENKEDLQRRENSSTTKRPRVSRKKLVKSGNGDEKSSTKEADLTTGTTQTTKLIGAYRQKHGRWKSETRDPFCNKRINLGMFDTPEEASNAFLAKKLEFQKRKEAGEQVKVDHCKVRKLTTSPKKFVGAYPRKSGRGFSNITDPFTKRNIHFGEFDSPEEASNVYVAKRQELIKLKQARICIDGTLSECESFRSWEQNDGFESSSQDDCQQREPNSLTVKQRSGVVLEKRVLNGNKGDENFKIKKTNFTETTLIKIKPPKLVHETLQNSNNGVESSSGEEADLAHTSLNKFRGVRRKKTGRWGAMINDPFTKHQIWLDTFDTPEEASKVKKLDFNERKEAQNCMDLALPEYEPVKYGQQFDDSQILEQILIDNNGFLLGEFSNLDDELRIL